MVSVDDKKTKGDHQHQTPLETSQILLVILIQLCEAVNINVLFPFLAFMIEDLGYGGARLGTYAGSLAASFCGAQFCSSIFWGMFSDRFGRKPAIFLGTLGSAMGMLVFGLSTSFTQAIVARLISGFLCGNLGVMKSFLTEITDNTNRAYGFSLMSLAWSAGTVIAPIAGGWLCKPAEKYPKYFSKNSIFGKHPYFLPCFLCVILCVVSAFLSLFLMKETKGRAKGKNVENKYSVVANDAENDLDLTDIESVHSSPKVQNQLKYSRVSGIDTSSSSKGDTDKSDSDVEDDIEMTQLDIDMLKKISDMHGLNSDDLPTIKRKDSDQETVKSPLAHDDSFSVDHRDIDGGVFIADSCVDMEDEIELEEICCSSLFPAKSSSETLAVLRQHSVVMVCANYGLLAMAYILLDETLPLFLKANASQGGFSMGSTQIGFLLSTSGAVMLLFTYFILPHVAKARKALLFSIGIYGAVPWVFMWPFLAILGERYLKHISWGNTALWIALIFTMIVKHILACLSFTAVMIQVNHSVTSDYLGAVNGFGQSLAALARAIGPAIGGLLWSFSVKSHFVFFNFMAFAFLCVFCEIINLRLPASLESMKESKNPSKEDQQHSLTSMAH